MIDYKQLAAHVVDGRLLGGLDDNKIIVILDHFGWLSKLPNTELARQRAVLRLMCTLNPTERKRVNDWYQNGGRVKSMTPNQPIPPPKGRDIPATWEDEESDSSDDDSITVPYPVSRRPTPEVVIRRQHRLWVRRRIAEGTITAANANVNVAAGLQNLINASNAAIQERNN